MANSIETPPNSIWPNGLKLDSEEYVIFYPLGTNKVDISTVTWPEGDKLVSPYVYQNDKLVGFVDTKALIVSGTATTTMNYNHIEADFASISEGTLTVNAPNATVKKFTWSVVDNGDDETFDFIIIDFNTTDAETINTVRTAKRIVDNKLYDTDDNLIGTCDTSKIEVGGIFDEGAMIVDGLFCNMDITTGSDKGVILSEFNSDLSSLRDGATMFAFCNLTSFKSNLSSLTNGSYMFAYCPSLTSFASDLSSLTNGYAMFSDCSNLNSFTSDLSSLTDGAGMFYNCLNLNSFTSDLSSLTNCYWMFKECSNLTSFNADLSSLTDGAGMFYYCSKLESFSSDLSSLMNGSHMFNNCNLTSFSSDLSNLTDGSYMFLECENLTSFSSDLSNLTNGKQMFCGCFNLTSFSSDLPSLTSGYDMFAGCKLDTLSIKNIIDTINTYEDSLLLGMGCDNTETDKDLFAQEVGYSDMTSLLAALQAKGWTVEAQYNGRPTTTYGLRRPSEDTLPVFVKLEEVEEVENHTDYTPMNEIKNLKLNLLRKVADSTEDYTQFNSLEETEDHADYISEDGTKKFRLSWFHETTGSTEGYTQYATLEEAIEALNIKPIERN